MSIDNSISFQIAIPSLFPVSSISLILPPAIPDLLFYKLNFLF